MREWKLAEVRYNIVRQRQYEVAVLPIGATEPHGLHMPYGTDNYEIESLADRACERAHALGAKVILLPTIPYGVDTNQMAFPLAMSVNPSTLSATFGSPREGSLGAAFFCATTGNSERPPPAAEPEPPDVRGPVTALPST